MDNGSVNSNEHTIDPEFLLQCKKGFYAPLEPLYIWPDTGLPLRGRWSYDANLEANYSAAYRDFCGFPSFPPCIYKSGPIWPEREPPEAYRYIREPRPVYDHPISDRWERIGTQIYELLDSHDVKWTSIDPIAIANTDVNIEDMPFFCPFLLWIGVKQDTLAFHHAVSAAAAIKDTILSPAGFPEIEVAFRVSEVTFYATGSGPKLRPPESIETWLPDRVVEATKPFTPTLGLSLASLRTPYYEGTGALYFRLKFRENDNKPPGEHVVILTAAHVARPPAVYHNTGLEPSEIRRPDLGPSNDMVALGYSAYEKAIQTIMRMISHSHSNIQRKRRTIAKLGDKMEGEPSNTTDVRQDCQVKIEEETKTISRLNTLHDEVTKRRTSTSQRVVGRVVYASSIGADETTRYTRDWALIMLDKDMIDWENFPGNQIHIAHSFSLLTLSDAYISPLNYCRWMFQRREGTAGDSEAAESDGTDNGLLRVSGVAEHDEIFHAQDTDHKGQKVILVVKNGMATGTTIGCVNGLKSFTRIDMPECGIVKKTSLEVAILPYNPFRSFAEGMRRQVAFSAPGDSGAIVLDGRGRAVAMLNGGAGNAAAGETDISYGTPFCWLEKQIKETFPDCHLYD